RGAAPVVRLVRDDAEEPGPERRAVAEAAERAVRVHERVLRRFLGVGRVAGEGVGGAEGDALVGLHDLCVCVAVSGPCEPDELLLGEWPAHHRPLYTPAGRQVPRARSSSRPRMRPPSARRPLCSYSFVSQTFAPRIVAAVSSENRRSTYMSSP